MESLSFIYLYSLLEGHFNIHPKQQHLGVIGKMCLCLQIKRGLSAARQRRAVVVTVCGPASCGVMRPSACVLSLLMEALCVCCASSSDPPRLIEVVSRMFLFLDAVEELVVIVSLAGGNMIDSHAALCFFPVSSQTAKIDSNAAPCRRFLPIVQSFASLTSVSYHHVRQRFHRRPRGRSCVHRCV